MAKKEDDFRGAQVLDDKQQTTPDGNVDKPDDPKNDDKPKTKKNPVVRFFSAIGGGVMKAGHAVVEGVKSHPKTALTIVTAAAGAGGYVLRGAMDGFFGKKYTDQIPVETSFVDKDETELLNGGGSIEEIIPEPMDVPEVGGDD